MSVRVVLGSWLLEAVEMAMLEQAMQSWEHRFCQREKEACSSGQSEHCFCYRMMTGFEQAELANEQEALLSG